MHPSLLLLASLLRYNNLKQESTLCDVTEGSVSELRSAKRMEWQHEMISLRVCC